MKEARIILPAYERDGTPVGKGIAGQLSTKLIDAFGGYTLTVGVGGYRMADGSIKQEPVEVFDVAMPSGDDDGSLHQGQNLTEIAVWLCNVANQECVYLRYPSGLVVFVGRWGVTHPSRA